HPFAGTISFNAARAAATAHVPLLALRRPGWTPAEGDTWHEAASLRDAARLLPRLGRRVFLTTGRMGLAAFADLDGLWFLVRSVDPPAAPHPARMETLLDRGPFTLDGEREVLRRHRIDVVVTKESGGAATAPKLTAAREAGLPVVVVRRPAAPAGVPVVPGPEEALRAVREAYTRHRAAPGGAPAARGGGGPASAGGGPTTAGRVGDGVCGGAVAPTRAGVRAGPVRRVRPVRRARCRRLPGGRAAPGLTRPGNCGGSRRRPRPPRAARPGSARSRPAGSSAW